MWSLPEAPLRLGYPVLPILDALQPSLCRFLFNNLNFFYLFFLQHVTLSLVRFRLCVGGFEGPVGVLGASVVSRGCGGLSDVWSSTSSDSRGQIKGATDVN